MVHARTLAPPEIPIQAKTGLEWGTRTGGLRGILIKLSKSQSRFLDFAELPENRQFRCARNDKAELNQSFPRNAGLPDDAVQIGVRPHYYQSSEI